jgi:hypothetical protein
VHRQVGRGAESVRFQRSTRRHEVTAASFLAGASRGRSGGSVGCTVLHGRADVPSSANHEISIMPYPGSAIGDSVGDSIKVTIYLEPEQQN